jgi:hypothetical protein
VIANPWLNASFTEHKNLMLGLAFALGLTIGFALGIVASGYGV